MQTSTDLEIKDKWLLTLIDMAPLIKSRTRLQKIALLASCRVLYNEEFFDDWQPDRFGGFSPTLLTSLEKLERLGYIRSLRAVTKTGHRVMRYESLKKGKAQIREFVRDKSQKLESLRSAMFLYFYEPLRVLLMEVYRFYPNLTVNNEIMDEVNKSIDRLEDATLEYESTSIGPAPPPPIPLEEQHVLGDMKMRKELAKSIGLERVPDLDPKAFDEIKGLLTDYIDTENFDPVEAVREVRGS